MRSLVIGDVHGQFSNLRKFLLEQEAIDENNKRINKDELKVYCSGDYIDGGKNRGGDMLCLEYVEEWFDHVALGNHEYSFIGGPKIWSLRRHDRPLQRSLLNLLHKGVYVPAFVVEGYLITHSGLAEEWGFLTADAALDYINLMWDAGQDGSDEIPVFDWTTKTGHNYGDSSGGIFWSHWTDKRNRNFNQIMGHTIRLSGPLRSFYTNDNGTVEHWNVDVGGKHGDALGGVIIEDGKAEAVFWGKKWSVNSYPDGDGQDWSACWGGTVHSFEKKTLPDADEIGLTEQEILESMGHYGYLHMLD